jgi:hypothetical protein
MGKHFLLAIGLAVAFTLSPAEYQIHNWKKFHLTQQTAVQYAAGRQRLTERRVVACIRNAVSVSS